MDATSPLFSKDKYEQIVAEISPFLKKLRYDLNTIPFIPISGLNGDNLVENSTCTTWYKGPTLLEAFDNIPKPERELNKPLRLPLQGSCYPVDASTLAVDAFIVTGRLIPKMTVGTGKRGHMTHQVKSVRRKIDNKLPLEAFPGDNVTVYFSSKGSTSTELSSGSVLSNFADRPAMQVENFISRVIIRGEITAGLSGMLYCHTACVPVRIEKLVAKIDKKTAEETEEGPKQLKEGDAGIVMIVPLSPLVVEGMSDCPALGQFALYHDSEMVAVGAITKVQLSPLDFLGLD